jgi:hypothetical protein
MLLRPTRDQLVDVAAADVDRIQRLEVLEQVVRDMQVDLVRRTIQVAVAAEWVEWVVHLVQPKVEMEVLESHTQMEISMAEAEWALSLHLQQVLQDMEVVLSILRVHQIQVAVAVLTGAGGR